jgi:hypothetical protein
VVTPASVTLTGIPYATYDIIVYVGAVYPDNPSDQGADRRTGYAQLNADAASRRYFGAASAPPFHGFIEATSTTAGDYKAANYVRYRNLSGATQTVSVQSPPVNTPVCIHGIQIIDTITDSDGDGNRVPLQSPAARCECRCRWRRDEQQRRAGRGLQSP